ncbi:hypothetical protein Bca101_034597 [Brassica carinata]|uniref:Uncharacterized protein n=2 Tax=Brassica TaxID=3705 RepID=A0A0D3EIB0_BRAOL
MCFHPPYINSLSRSHHSKQIKLFLSISFSFSAPYPSCLNLQLTMSERPSRHQRRPSQTVFPISLEDLSDISLTANPPSSIPSQPPRHQIPPPSPAAPPANRHSKDGNDSKEGNASSN